MMMRSHQKTLILKSGNLHRQRGIAVISAMLVAALVTAVVAQLLWQQQLLISELENQQNATQATWMADAAIDWSRAILAEDANNGRVDHSREIWSTRLPATPIEGGQLSGYIIDQEQFFNLNNLMIENRLSETNLKTLQRLLELLNLKPSQADALADWLDADINPISADGAEDNYYLGLNPPYRSGNQALNETGNLIRVKGFDAAAINKISRFATALPTTTSLNVNTASAQVLQFALPNATLQDAQAIVAMRNMAFFSDLADFSRRLPNKEIPVNQANLSVNSHYFLVTCFAQFGRSQLKVEALLFRDEYGWPTILWKRAA